MQITRTCSAVSLVIVDPTDPQHTVTHKPAEPAGSQADNARSMAPESLTAASTLWRIIILSTHSVKAVSQVCGDDKAKNWFLEALMIRSLRDHARKTKLPISPPKDLEPTC